MSVTIETERNKDAATYAGKYFDKGGNASKPVKDAEKCPCCGGEVEESMYVGFVFCPSCQFDFPAALCIEDKVEATKVYLKYLKEIILDHEQAQKNLHLKQFVTKLFKSQVYQTNNATLYKTFIHTKEWQLYVKRSEEITGIKYEYYKHGYITKRQLERFFKFLRGDPRVQRGKEEVTAIMTSKDDLMEIIADKDQEIIKLKSILNQYGLL